MAAHFDCIVIGAGISGIDAAYHLQTHCPTRSFRVFERRDRLGGTWDVFRYPGIRSDSDMHTFGFGFKPWSSTEPIAPGEDIVAYLHNTVEEVGVRKHIQFSTHIVEATWSSADARWSLVSATGEQFSCRFLFCCGGYFDYDEPYQPYFPGQERFRGRLVHPQKWGPEEDRCYQGRRVAVIGSGATAVTLIPNLVKGGAAHVTMVQRTPTYMLSIPKVDTFSATAARLLPAQVVHGATRWKNVLSHIALYRCLQAWPATSRRLLLRLVQKQLGNSMTAEEFKRHFRPPYNPWDQRLCIVPEGDIFRCLKNGEASVVTGHIEAITERGIQMENGEHVDADVIVTATGLTLQQNYPMSTMRVTIDGEPYDAPQRLLYKSAMVSGVPNFAFTVGYANASWTLRADLTSAFVCRLLNHMESRGFDMCCPRPDAHVQPGGPILGLTSGYVRRAESRMPKQGSQGAWRSPGDYVRDGLQLRSVEDRGLEFRPARRPPAARM